VAETATPIRQPSSDLPGWTTVLFWVGVIGATVVVLGRWAGTSPRLQGR